MRALPLALAISAVVHGGAIAWVTTRPNVEPPKLVTPAPPANGQTTPAEPQPVEVVLLDDDSVVTPAPIASPAGHTSGSNKKQQHVVASHGVAGATTGATTVETPAPSSETPPPRNKLMTMRHPEIKEGLSQEFWEKFEANTKPLQPKEIAGERRADELATIEGHLGNQRWIDNASADEVLEERMKLAEKRYEQSTAELKSDGAGTKADHHTFKTKFNPDGTVASIKDKRNFRFDKFPLSGEFDITDAMMRRQGIDPYASYKLKVLDETRDERAAIGKRYRTQQLAQSRHLMQKNLERLWASTTDLAARKQGLFELWDDCAETGGDELVTGGASARTHVIGFIRSKLPEGTTQAFTADELARLNKQRRSRAIFDPYQK